MSLGKNWKGIFSTRRRHKFVDGGIYQGIMDLKD